MDRGNQIPRLQIEPDRLRTDGTDAATLMEAYNCKLDPWQMLVVDCWLGTDQGGKYTVTSAGLSVPRQNGKNVCLETREFFGLVIKGERILHTAHQVVTGKKSFRRLAAMFTDRRHPEVMALVKRICYTNGEEAIELKNGGIIEFSARSRQRARGFDGISLIIYDEAQELTDDQVEAIMATLAASATGTRQIIYTGTPPYPGCPGTVFRRIRQACISDPGKHDAWHEWSVDAETPEAIDITASDIWRATNPAMGYRLTEEFTGTELATMTKDGFARERLGWWSPALAAQCDYAISAAAWDACKSEQLKPDGKTAYGVKFSYDGTKAVLCGAVIPSQGPARISLIAQHPTSEGIKWLADWLNERYSKAACVVIDGRNGTDVLVDRISETWKAKGSIVLTNAKNILAATSTLTNAIDEKSVTWFFGQEMLRESAISSIKRPISGGWGFGGENSAPIEAAALALWGAKTSKRDPSRKMRIG